MKNKKILIVDLNNFARYPTLAIGYLVVPLRHAGFTVEVFSPLTHGAPAMTHEMAETQVEHFKRRLFFSLHPLMKYLREPLRALNTRLAFKPHTYTLNVLERRFRTDPPDIVLLSAYLDHYPTVKWIGEQADRANIPVLLGGPAFTHPDTIADWQCLRGISAVFGGEADNSIAQVVSAMLQRRSLKGFLGVSSGHGLSAAAPPLALEHLPIPDFSDFPWQHYPHHIIPIMSGRGCSWDKCTFCSDVATSNGRSFRSRPLTKVLEELATQAQRYQAKDFIFLDLKLNSDLHVWHGLIDNFQTVVPQGRWIATVHVDAKMDNGLDLISLQKAKAAGLTRISFGLETGSQNLARRMAKGTQVERNAQFVKDAHAAGLSVRCSMMLGYPHERLEDLLATHQFLTEHQQQLDRVRLARFKAIPGTRFERLYHKRPQRFEGIAIKHWDYRLARADYVSTLKPDRAYRQMVRDILAIIHNINRRPLRNEARQFDGLM